MKGKQEVIDLMKNYEIRKAFCENVEHRCNIIRARMAAGYDEKLGKSEISDLEKQKRLAIEYIRLAESGLNILNEAEKKAIYRFYIHRSAGHIDMLCEELSCEERQVYKYKERALNKICISFYGSTDSI